MNKCPQKQSQQNCVQGRVNHVSSETAQEASDVVIGTLLVNSNLASVDDSYGVGGFTRRIELVHYVM